jgi:hypothetical protein
MNLQYPYRVCGYFLLYTDQYDDITQSLPVRLLWKQELAGYAAQNAALPSECALLVDEPIAQKLWMTSNCFTAYMKVDEPLPTFFLEEDGFLYPVGYQLPPIEPTGSEFGSGSGSGSGEGGYGLCLI